MTAESDYQRAFDEYIRQGTDYIPVHQANFMDRVPYPEFAYSGCFSKSLSQVRRDGDVLRAAAFVRALYVPNFKAREFDSLVEALEWGIGFQYLFHTEAARDGLMIKTPRCVEDNSNTFFFLMSLDDFGYAKLGRGERRRFVSFDPDTQGTDRKSDIHQVTLAHYEKLRLGFLTMGKRINPNLLSTSRTLNILTTFFWSKGEDRRAEGIDLLTYEMLKVYWMKLVGRAKIKDPLQRL